MDLSLLSAPELVEEIGGRVRRERLRQHLSQHTLAERAGVSRLTVTRLEAGTSTTLTNFVSVLVALRRSGDLAELLSPVEIHYEGEAGTWIVGPAVQRGSTTLIEYTDEHLARNVELAPVHHRRETRTRIFDGRSPEHLPGLLSDALPDAWGQLVVGRDMRQHGIDQASVL